MTSAHIDFLKAPGTPRAGWLLLGLGAGALALALWMQTHWSAQTAREVERRQHLQAQARSRALPPAPVVPTPAQRYAQQAALALQRPWLPALRAIEAATVAPIYLLSLSIDPTQDMVKIEGDAPSFDHALAYVQMLDEGHALQPAALLSHETVVEPGTGRSYVRFVATTRWSGP